ncbi:potassium channel family protein [Kineococcus auxinigenes]|uniref:potassium channel family protein n=1 Tax=unclassified Kineococcus TaxID=2621656 RepID=UPI003D7D44D3
MHFVIMGCGRVGSTLALTVEHRGHSVAVVDQDADAFRRLGASFNGRRITGVGFDHDTLVEAGIHQADAFAAVSSGDNSNILAARVAREKFDVETVVARIYDPGRAEVYQRLGIPTIATVRWTADQVLRRLVPEGALSEFRDASGHVVMVEAPVHEAWIGRPLHTLEAAAGVRVAYVTRLGQGVVPVRGMVHQEGDLVHVVVAEERTAAATAVLAAAPEEGA